MRWTNRPRLPAPKWQRVFALTPHFIYDNYESHNNNAGHWAWLEWLERRYAGETIDYISCYEYRHPLSEQATLTDEFSEAARREVDAIAPGDA